MPAIRGVVFSVFGTLLTDLSTETPVQAADGAEALIRRCYGRFRLALASTDPNITASDVWETLASLDWHRYFETISTTADLDADADDPRLFRAAASSLGIQTGQLVVVCADSDPELQGANAAGCWSLRVGKPNETPQPGLRRPDRAPESADSLEAIPAALDKIVSR